MLSCYLGPKGGPVAVDLNDGAVPPAVTWIDAVDPTPHELATLTRVIGVKVPNLAALEEIETSSRLSLEGDAILLSLSAAARDDKGFPRGSPIGFVLTRERVLTLRFARFPIFEALAAKTAVKPDQVAHGGLDAALTILEAMIDHLADVLEHIGGDLDEMSRRIFASDMMSATTRRPRQTNEAMNAMLRTVGRNGDLASRVSQTLLGLHRMMPYIAAHAGDLTPEHKSRLDVMSRDAGSLSDYDEHLAGKTQFLLDTLLGLANIEQNNVFRVLTIVSVVGIPPTFFASMWGMNFKSMPELNWSYGYAMGLSVIAISAIVPALWFKVKGWW